MDKARCLQCGKITTAPKQYERIARVFCSVECEEAYYKEHNIPMNWKKTPGNGH